MTQAQIDREEIARLGRERYELEIRPLVEALHRGEYLVLDVETGDYEIDPDHVQASDRAAPKCPGALLYAVRIGYPTLGRIGARIVRGRS